MKYRKLGNTDLNVSIAGLGCGGKSRLGLRLNKGEDNAIKIIRQAYDMGVNFFDTAECYGTEEVLGKGLMGISRDKIIISSKFTYCDWGDNVLKKGSLTKALDNCLKSIKSDYVDIYHYHGVIDSQLNEAIDTFADEMYKAKKAGKVRYAGITERFFDDTSHEMFKNAIDMDMFDVIMVGHNLMNYSAQKTILPKTIKKGIGTLDMFAVRTALSKRGRLIEIVKELVDKGVIDKSTIDLNDPLGFITKDVAKSVMDASYRFCANTKGIDVVLTGTSSVEHLMDNINSINGEHLNNNILKKIDDIFGNVDSVSAQ